ncbi:TetR family transcriptional regulator C-terminal domain-containing protein [Paraburkholderia sp. BCC1884]|uniref:TetR family transcriptional regulator C-terminal domain-containing protein n=1 Tax=Paraburkholderia sp. BCC1884 TaxID=2562668 RepID=UPI001642AA5F|nr:hypothetical protein [Paraburkholderia sp. BCC1884]
MSLVNERKGCLLANSALEVAPHDTEFQQTIADMLARVEAFLRHCMTAGQMAAEISETEIHPCVQSA